MHSNTSQIYYLFQTLSPPFLKIITFNFSAVNSSFFSKYVLNPLIITLSPSSTSVIRITSSVYSNDHIFFFFIFIPPMFFFKLSSRSAMYMLKRVGQFYLTSFFVQNSLDSSFPILSLRFVCLYIFLTLTFLP